MLKKRKKTITFDAMVRFFMKTYEIPTKDDIKKLLDKMDRLEQQLVKIASIRSKRKGEETATDAVMNAIIEAENGIAFPEILIKTGLEEKPVRNIIFRLGSLNKIKRIRRGVYGAA